MHIHFFTSVLAIFFLLSHTSSASSLKYYRTTASGFWHDPAVWETADDSSFTMNISQSTDYPDYYSHQIFIRSGHVITISQSTNIDETIIDYNGVLTYGNYTSSIFTIENGAGIDLMIYGTFEESGPFSTVWNNSPTWMLGNTGTIIRTRSTSATTWRDRYEKGMKNIPASSNWIIRKQGADNPSVSAINTFYGNLFIENMTANFWDAIVVGSRFTGFGGSAVIKGNFNIGGNGNNGLKFYIENSSLIPANVLGNLIIKNSSTLYLDNASTTTGATGIELKGDMIVEGTLSYNPAGANADNRKIVFSGNLDQHMSGNGLINIYNSIINKSSGSLILQRNMTIDRSLILNNGSLFLNSHQLYILNNNATGLQRNKGWIKSEDTSNSGEIIWSIGSSYENHIFPFGKNDSTYIPFHFDLVAGNAGDVKVSTYGTNTDNLPLPHAPVLVTNIENAPSDIRSKIVDRFWQVDATGNYCLANLTFSYDDLEEPFDEAVLFASRFDISSGLWEIPVSSQTSNATGNYVLINDISSFSTWTLNGNGIPLSFHETGKTSFNFQKNENEFVEIFIYNLLGQLIGSKRVDMHLLNERLLLDEFKIPAGIYILKTLHKNSVSSATCDYPGLH